MKRILSAALVLVCLPAAFLMPGRIALAADNEIVPEGAWLIRAGTAVDTLDRAFSTLNREDTLKAYLIPDDAIRSQIDGEVEREVERFDLLFRYGISDTWNLSLEVPFYRITQTSTLSTGSSDPAVVEQVERLRSRSVSGLGDLRLTSLHRGAYTDRQAFVWGYGLKKPGGDVKSPYAGRSTLYLGSPFTSLFGLVHYSRFLFDSPGRFDLQGTLELPMKEELEDLAGKKIDVNPGNSVRIFIGWEQDIDAFFLAGGVSVYNQGNTAVEGNKQGDPVKEIALRLKVGTGNLRELERAPIAFPYLVYLQLDQTIKGFNTPLRNEITIFLQTYF